MYFMSLCDNSVKTSKNLGKGLMVKVVASRYMILGNMTSHFYFKHLFRYTQYMYPHLQPLYFGDDQVASGCPLGNLPMQYTKIFHL